MLIGRWVQRFYLLQRDITAIGRHEIHLYLVGGGQARFDDGPCSRILQAEEAGIEVLIGDDDGRARCILYLWRHSGWDKRGASGERANDR